MSQVTEQSVRFQTALASIKLIPASAVLDLTEDDFAFLTSINVWIATDRSRARRCGAAWLYGTLDFVANARALPLVESMVDVIAWFVHPVLMFFFFKQKTAYEISLPVAITVFPEEVYRAPETWARR